MNKPTIILVRPQLGENIGMAARAMGNFGLDELRLVAPRDGWPNPSAGPAAAAASNIIKQARVFSTAEQAVGDLAYVFATTVRQREIAKGVTDARNAACEMVKLKKTRVGIMYGPERSGLSNEEINLADKILTVPVNPSLGSLNLALAVGVVSYEWFVAKRTPFYKAQTSKSLASKDDLINFFKHLEEELDKKNYFRSPARRKSLTSAIRNIFQGANLDSQQVRTLRGVIKALTRAC